MRRGDRDRGGVRAAATERRDVAVLVDALEAGDDRDLPRLQRSKILEPLDGLDARLREGAVGQDLHLMAEEDCAPVPPCAWMAIAVSAADDLLAGGGERVHLAGVGDRRDLVRELEQAIGLAAHGAHDDDDVVPSLLRGDCAGRRRCGCARAYRRTSHRTSGR